MDHIMLPAGLTQRVVCSPMNCVVALGCSIAIASDVYLIGFRMSL